RCGDGVVDGNQGQGVADFECYGCCDAEFCDDAASSPFLCVDCNAYAPTGLRGCLLNVLEPFSVKASGALGTATLTRGYFAEVYGDWEDSADVTGLNFVFVADGVDAPTLHSALLGSSWCLWSGLEFGAVERPKTELFWLNIDGETELLEATLVLDDAAHWNMSSSDYVARVYGRFEGAITGDFVATYCDELVVANDYYPS
ncbi:MAG: hypothetical protein KC486_29650, partial [Myxococcales bacterium]|nr:hypothetical protein [Myxococcales bacterium]